VQSSASPVRVGLVGAGPWAQLMHGPTLAAHPGVDLTAVWARRPDAAAELAATLGTSPVTSLDALFDACDALVFSIPPDAQAEIAAQAARAGKAMLLEKPIGLDLATAERLADVVAETGARTQLVLTWRYTQGYRDFLTRLAAADVLGGRAEFLTGSLLGGPFATPWRLAMGGWHDLAPHLLDAVDAAFGEIVGIRAHASARDWTGALVEHATGVLSEVSITGSCPIPTLQAGVEAACTSGLERIDMAKEIGPDTFTRVIDEFVVTASGTPHHLDVHRGLFLQRWIETAASQTR
jgi:predicted dehydrogenase